MDATRLCWKKYARNASLRKSIKNGDLESLQRILSQLDAASLADMFSEKGKDWDLVHIAVESGELEALAMLLEYGATADGESYAGVTPLMLACRGGHHACAALLLGRGAHILATDKLHGWTSLHHACIRGNLEMAELLIDAILAVAPDLSLVADFVNKKDLRGITALHLASLSYRAHPLITFLLEQGALVNSRVRIGVGQGSTALHFAARTGSVAVISELLLWGANKRLQDCEGRTPYSIALLFGKPDCARLLNPKVPEPLVWPTAHRCHLLTTLEEPTKRRLLSALKQANEERMKAAVYRKDHSVVTMKLTQFFRKKKRNGFNERGAQEIDEEKKGQEAAGSERLANSGDKSKISNDLSGEDEYDNICGVCLDGKHEILLEKCGHLLCATCTVSMCCLLKPVMRFEEGRKILCPFCRDAVLKISELK